MMRQYYGILTAALTILPLTAVAFPETQGKRSAVQSSKSELNKRQLDSLVMEAVFRDLLENDLYEITKILTRKSKSPSIRLISQSTGYWALRSSNQVKAFREGFDRLYTEWLFNKLKKDIQQRNQSPTQLDYLALKSKNFQLQFWNVPTNESDDRGRISISLPGYSPDRNWVIVGLGIESDGRLFRYTCMVVRSKQGWDVRMRSLEELPK